MMALSELCANMNTYLIFLLLCGSMEGWLVGDSIRNLNRKVENERNVENLRKVKCINDRIAQSKNILSI